MVPVEFKRFTRLFLQGSHETAKDMPAFVRQAVRLLDADQMPVVKSYVAELLASGLDEHALNDIWLSCSPNYWIEEGAVREFLAEVQKALDE